MVTSKSLKNMWDFMLGLLCSRLTKPGPSLIFSKPLTILPTLLYITPGIVKGHSQAVPGANTLAPCSGREDSL